MKREKLWSISFVFIDNFPEPKSCSFLQLMAETNAREYMRGLLVRKWVMESHGKKSKSLVLCFQICHFVWSEFYCYHNCPLQSWKNASNLSIWSEFNYVWLFFLVIWNAGNTLLWFFLSILRKCVILLRRWFDSEPILHCSQPRITGAVHWHKDFGDEIGKFPVFSNLSKLVDLFFPVGLVTTYFTCLLRFFGPLFLQWLFPGLVYFSVFKFTECVPFLQTRNG